MSKITYNKKALKHDGAKKVKRMVTKIATDSPNISMYLEITGNSKHDKWELQFEIDRIMNKVAKRLNEEIEENNKNRLEYLGYVSDYSVNYLSEHLKAVSDIYDILHYISNNYWKFDKKEIETKAPELS